MKNISREELISLLDYNPVTGIFVWKHRTSEHFKRERDMNAWNARFSGRLAGCPKPTGHIEILINYQKFLAHQLAWILMTGQIPEIGIDHKDTNPRNNSWSNLRLATKSQNGMNRGIQSNNKSGFKGVYWNESIRKWTSHIQINGNTKFLGNFADPIKAHAAYCEAASKYHGEFAKVA